MNENHEGQAPLVPGADGIAATAISGREAPKAVDLGRPSPGAFANEANLSSEMGEGDMDSKCEIDRLKQKIVDLERQLKTMREELIALICDPKDNRAVDVLIAGRRSDSKFVSKLSISCLRILKLIDPTISIIE
jgi:hypothetical protein